MDEKELEKKENEVLEKEYDEEDLEDFKIEDLESDGETHAPEQVEEEKEPTETTAKEEEKAPEEPTEKTFTQSQVNELVGNTRKEARDRILKELLERYGVSDNSELDGVFGKGQKYDLLNEDYTNQGNELSFVKTENALLKSKIREDRWEDAKAILGSKGLEVTVENILSETATHPEWLGSEEGQAKVVGREELDNISKNVNNVRNRQELDNMLNERPSTITRIGTESDVQKEPVDEKKKAMSLFGL